MHDRQTGCAGLVPVQRLRPGDHAFVGYGVGESRWQVLTAYVWLGLARHEKGMVLADPDIPQQEVLTRLDTYGPQAAAARARGQLVLSSMREVIESSATRTAAASAAFAATGAGAVVPPACRADFNRSDTLRIGAT